MFITTKSILDDLLNHFAITGENRDEAYRLYALGKEGELENFINRFAGLPAIHAE